MKNWAPECHAAGCTDYFSDPGSAPPLAGQRRHPHRDRFRGTKGPITRANASSVGLRVNQWRDSHARNAVSAPRVGRRQKLH